MKFRKILAVALSLVIMLSVTAFAKTSEEVDTHLQFNEDGSFKIMQIADMQDSYPLAKPTKMMIKQAIAAEKPDLIVLTGDNIAGYTALTKVIAKAAINEYMSIFEEAGIPVAMVYGNHDDQVTLANKKFQMSVYESYDCFVGCAGEDMGNDKYYGTYNVPIYSSENENEMVFNLWMIDSGNYNSENNLGGYACVTKTQVDWYKSVSEKLEYENGHKIPSMAFQHIVVPEIYDALTEVDEGTEGAVGHDGKYYVLPEGATGELNESPCPPNYSNGEFDAMAERGDVVAMFFGHDHLNTYDVDYKGVTLSCSPGAGFASYDGDVLGIRTITLNESNPEEYDTQILGYYDILDAEDNAVRYLYKMYSDTSSVATKFACFFKYIFTLLGV